MQYLLAVVYKLPVHVAANGGILRRGHYSGPAGIAAAADSTLDESYRYAWHRRSVPQAQAIVAKTRAASEAE